MAKKIDWMYNRKACTTCKKAHSYMDAAGGIDIKEMKEASKDRIGPEEALALAKTVSKIVAMKGKKLVELSPKDSTDEELLAHLMGPTGNLRAPTAIVGKTLMVGFNEDGYKAVLGL